MESKSAASWAALSAVQRAAKMAPPSVGSKVVMSAVLMVNCLAVWKAATKAASTAADWAVR